MPTQPAAAAPSLPLYRRYPALWLTTLFTTLVLLLVALMLLQAAIFDGLRSFVRAESLWSKGQKDAVLYLTRYIHSRDDSDYAGFMHAYGIVVGDRQARIALLQAKPDLERARTGFLEGGNHPDDVDGMVWFFLNFQSFEPMQKIIKIWIEGENRMEQLIRLGQDIRKAILMGQRDRDLGDYLQRIEVLNQEMHLLENSFSLVLGDTARGLRRMMWVVSLGLLVLCALAAGWAARRVVGGLTGDDDAEASAAPAATPPTVSAHG